MTDFELIHARFGYNPNTGLIFSKVDTHGHGRKIPAGSPVGATVGNRVKISINDWRGQSKQFMAHRVAWLLTMKEWPSLEIDHIDGNGTNNRWTNLRLATRSQNGMNRAKQINNTSGYKGVTKHGPNWRAQIWAEGKHLTLGGHKTKEEAYAAYCEAAKRMHGNFGTI
jgi:hypothetical protein